MAVEDFGTWRRELLAIDLVPHDDDSVPQEEADRRWARFVELADLVDGSEGTDVASTLVAALRAEEDYGAHQAVYSALERLEPQALTLGVVAAAVDLVTIPWENSGAVLQLATLVATPDDLTAFGTALDRLDPRLRSELIALITQHEQGEWLADERSIGRLRAQPR